MYPKSPGWVKMVRIPGCRIHFGALGYAATSVWTISVGLALYPWSSRWSDSVQLNKVRQSKNKKNKKGNEKRERPRETCRAACFELSKDRQAGFVLGAWKASQIEKLQQKVCL